MKSSSSKIEGEPNNEGQTEKEIKQLHKKRATLLKNKNKSKNEKIELNVISRLIRNKIRNREQNRIIRKTIEGNMNVRRMKTRLRLGTQWITYFEKKEGIKISNRIEINEYISKYYETLYDDDKSRTPLESTEEQNHQENEPKFLFQEVEKVINELKNNKSPGHDRITNEFIKNGGGKT